jgi:hypothetical protein
MKTYGSVGVKPHVLLTSTLVRGGWSASHPGCFAPGESAPVIPWIGSRVGPRAGLNAVEKLKFLSLPGLEVRPLGRPFRIRRREYQRFVALFTTR